MIRVNPTLKNDKGLKAKVLVSGTYDAGRTYWARSNFRWLEFPYARNQWTSTRLVRKDDPPALIVFTAK